MSIRWPSFALAWLLLAVAPARAVAQQGGAQSPIGKEKFSIVVLPDTQFYANMDTNLQFQQRWTAQTAWIGWIEQNRSAYNIAFVSVLGDVVQNFGQYGQEWNVARNAMNLLHQNSDPFAAPITSCGYSVVIGNHDYDHKQWTGTNPYDGSPTNIVYGTSNWRARFGLQYYANHGYSWWGGSDQGYVYNQPIHGTPGPWIGEGLNRFQVIEAGGCKMLHLGLELGVPDYAIAWAEQVIAQHPGMPTIVSTHGLINGLGLFLNIYQMWREDVGNSGQEVWDKFLKRHAEICIVFCGHMGTVRTTTLVNDFGSNVYIFLTDYMVKHLPGEAANGVGWLRVYTIDPVQGTLRGQTYSPVLDVWASNSGSGPIVTYPAPATGNELDGTMSDFTIPVDWSSRF